MMGVGKASGSTGWGGSGDESVSKCIRSAGHMGASQDTFFLQDSVAPSLGKGENML